MQKIGVDRKWRLASFVLGDRNLMLLGKLDELAARGKVPFPPRRDHRHVGLERIVGKLEPDLIVALAGRAVRTASAPTFSAISICFFAISGRAIDVPSRYWPSYSAFARNIGNT